MRAKSAALVLSVVASGLAPGATAQEEPAAAPVALQTGPATIAPHWSRYEYPTEVGEGVPYHIIQKGDTLWDLAALYLGEPLLWPQIWNQNPYITDAHWIYPGDPVMLQELLVVSEQAGQPESLPPDETTAGAGRTGVTGAEAADQLFPATAPQIIQCAPYIADSPDDESIRIVGNEEDDDDGRRTKLAVADRDIVYLNRGSSNGIQPGDRFSVHHRRRPVVHPSGGRPMGWRVETVAVARVILVQPDSATAVIEQSCLDVRLQDYLLPYQERPVPYLMKEPWANRMTPPSGKAQGQIVDFDDPALAVAAGHLVHVDLGSADGVAPGTRLVAFRRGSSNVSGRQVLGELAVLTANPETSVAKVMQSYKEMLRGDQVELK